jgi:hypothetical protein
MEIIDLIRVHIEDPMIQMPFIPPRHVDVVIPRNPRTVIVSDTEKDVNVLLVSDPLENSPHDDHLVHEVIPNHQFLAIVLNVEKMTGIFINPEVDGTRMIRPVIRGVRRRRMENVGFIQSIKLICSMLLVYTVLMDVFPAFDYCSF